MEKRTEDVDQKRLWFAKPSDPPVVRLTLVLENPENKSVDHD